MRRDLKLTKYKYDSEVGVGQIAVSYRRKEDPSMSDIRDFCINKLGSSAALVLGTVRWFPYTTPYPMVSAFIRKVEKRIPAKKMDKSRLQAFAKNQYMDVELREPWRKEEIFGEYFFIRDKDDVEEVLAKNESSEGPRTARAAAQVLSVTAKTGQKVRYINDQGELSQGKIIEKKGVDYIIKDHISGTVNRPPGCVVEVIGEDEPDVKELMSQIYGEEFANQMI